MTFRAEFEHRDDLLRAALGEFSDRGYENASINRILAASGMSKGQLYHHFSSKEGLYLALVEWMIDRKLEWLTTHTVEFGDDVVALVGAQMRASVRFAREHPDVEALSRSLLAERGRPIFTTVVARFAFDPDSALGAVVELGYEQGQFRPELSLDFVRQAVLTIINSAPDLLRLDEPADLEKRLEELLTFLRGGLLRSPS